MFPSVRTKADRRGFLKIKSMFDEDENAQTFYCR
jgi:hypothetical protein